MSKSSRRLSATSYIMHLLMNQRSLQWHDTTLHACLVLREDGLPAARTRTTPPYDMGRSATHYGKVRKRV